MALPAIRSRRLRIVGAVLALVWFLLATFGGKADWVKRQADSLIAGAEAVDPFLVLREFFGQFQGGDRGPAGLAGVATPALGLGPATTTFPPIDYLKYTRPPEPPSSWERLKDWVKPPPASLPTGRINIVGVVGALRMVLWKVMDAGWPALLPALLSLYVGAAVWEAVFKKPEDAVALLHPGALVLFCGVVFAAAGAAAFLFRLFLLLLLHTLGAAAVVVGYATPFVVAVNEVVAPAFEAREKIRGVVEAVKADPPAAETVPGEPRKPEPGPGATEGAGPP